MKINTEKNKGPSEASAPRNEGRDRDHDSDRSSEKDHPFPRRRSRPPGDLFIDYKDIETLRPFLMDAGRIVPARVSRLNRMQQRELTRAVKRARHLALLPMSPRHN